jgi:hypothetical protein
LAEAGPGVSRPTHCADRDLGTLGHATRELDETIDQVLTGAVDDGELVGRAADVDADDVRVRIQSDGSRDVER